MNYSLYENKNQSTLKNHLEGQLHQIKKKELLMKRKLHNVKSDVENNY
jgi:hypothetical protein